MSYTVEFEPGLLDRLPREEHPKYKEVISNKIIEHLEHRFYRIKPVRNYLQKGIYEMKISLRGKGHRVAFSLRNNQIFVFYISTNLQKAAFDKEVKKKIAK